jgi:hypothetical protein
MTASLEAMRSELNAAVGSAEPGLAAANELCAACVGLFGVDGAAVSTVYEGAAQWTFGSSSESSRRLDEYQFTFGEGPCIDAVVLRKAVLVPDLGAPHERRWPVFTEAMLGEGFRSVFALPVVIAATCVGALDLFRADPGPLRGDELAGARLAAEIAGRPLLDLLASGALDRDDRDHREADDERNHDDSRQGSLYQGRSDEMDLNRVEIYQATGMLIHQLDVDPAQAVARLRAHAMATNQSASQVAFAIIERRLVLERDDHTIDEGGT